MALAVKVIPEETAACVSEQIASALQILCENAASPLERAVLSNACLLCGRQPDIRDSAHLSMRADVTQVLHEINPAWPVAALEYLHAEAIRNDLTVTGYILNRTLGLWAIARMIHLDGGPDV